MEVEDMQTEEEKMELEDNTVGHNLNSSNMFSIYIWYYGHTVEFSKLQNIVLFLVCLRAGRMF